VGEDVTVAKTLTIFLAADVSKLNRQLKSAQNDLNLFSNGIGGVAGKLSNLMGPALIGAAAAAGAFAVKLGVDGVKAAIDDEAALAKLTTTLDNVGLAHRTDEIDAYIDALEQSIGYLGDLRPQYDRLIRSTRDTAEANRALEIALDVAAGTGRDLDSVVQALGRAFDGNTAGLSRLGAGIDAATLATKDMDLITGQLAETFGGQAKTQAATLQGQMQQLQRATEQVTEAFGQGLLAAFSDTESQTSELVLTLEELEPAMNDLGETVGDTALTILDTAAAIIDANEAFNNFIDSFGPLRTVFDAANRQLNPFQRGTELAALALDLLGNEADDVPNALSGTVAAAISGSKAMQGLATSTAIASDALSEIADKPSKAFYSVLGQLNKGAVESNYSLDRFDKTVESTGRNATSSAGSMKKLNTEAEVGAEKFASTEAVLKALNSQLQQQTRDLESATGAIATYAQGVADQITRGFDLSAGLTITDGQANAAEWLSGVDAEVAKYQWFGNVLAEIQRQGGPELREYFAQLGVDAGGAMGQAAISGGLVPQLASKLAEVQQAAYEVGQAFVPEGALAGEEYALGLVNATVKQIAKDEKRFRQIGENIGKPIGARIKEEIAQAVSDAIKAAEASRTAALAEISAREAATTAAAVEQATAQSLARLIRNSDNRAGRNVQPVLT
jgi:phosphopantetheinyl transferase (holo-ACP synthase)